MTRILTGIPAAFVLADTVPAQSSVREHFFQAVEITAAVSGS
jgi:hypothetical protein